MVKQGTMSSVRAVFYRLFYFVGSCLITCTLISREKLMISTNKWFNIYIEYQSNMLKMYGFFFKLIMWISSRWNHLFMLFWAVKLSAILFVKIKHSQGCALTFDEMGGGNWFFGDNQKFPNLFVFNLLTYSNEILCTALFPSQSTTRKMHKRDFS